MAGKGLAVVTGSSGALGGAIAIRLASLGYSVGLHYRSREDEVRRVAGVIRAASGSCMLLQADVREQAEVDRMMTLAQQQLGPVRVAVNNAGLVRDRSVLKLTTEDWDVVLDTNLKGAFHLARAALEAMRSEGAGRIVNISSIVGAMGNFGQVNYAASKAGLIGLTKALAKEVARHGVTVNAICPGFMDTPMVQDVPEDVQESLLAQIPLGRFGEPEAVAEAVAYLAGPGGDYVTGQVLHVNGGMYM